MKKNEQTKFLLAILFLLFLIIFLLIYSIYFINTELIKHLRIPQWQRILIVYSFTLLAILNLYTVKNLFSALSTLKTTQIYKDNIKSLDNFINILRAQRHEFNNHLQIIWGLICVGKYDDAVRYIEQISENLKCTSKFYGLGCAELSALIFAKSSLAKKYDINFEFHYNVDFSNLKFDSMDLINICGNLIDNAFYYAKCSLSKYVVLEINDTGSQVEISITNSGSYIDDCKKEKIFELGYSTKNSTGLGLFIVKSTVEKYGGQIEVFSEYKSQDKYEKEGYTTFKVTLPKKI
ncbi:signal transduction histidine kinase regulating citrate/malate metabolism [Caldicellulosiruptor saccharolyticus DSM 8903]|uniref:histidine kinase n=1 Tax=Caldicellulosiruptor saccharolyticus (strain ATCC 43494 / DSM 8903 / Tp8T 6331) TaxID=351627 RepID=A4XHJ8_CALS8|nr:MULTISPECIES: ATP-binding protein [Caldicellulosiruptor]ABP66383.1 signal transduction histidine kinase regulating citrate/malate metabolism [Caldicellulosiruptor saccharolyticus DSM 8903]